MPVQKGKQSILAKLGPQANKAVQNHATDTTDYGIIRIPPGITNGIAQLQECYFGEFKDGVNKGKPFFRAMGVVVSPHSIQSKGGEIVVAGCQTSIMEPICDTKTQKGTITTLDDHVARVMNEMRKLGIDTSGISLLSDLESMAEALTQAKPYFRFSTSVRKAQNPGQEDGVWENWHGNKGVEDYIPETTAASATDDETGGDSDGTATAVTQVSTNGSGKKTTPARIVSKAPQPAPEPFNEFEESNGQEAGSDDLEGLLEAANAEDEDARARLTAIATELGMSEEDVNAYQSWEDVVAAIQQAQQGGEGESQGEQPGYQKGQVVGYRPFNPVSKKPAPSPVAHEIVSVHEAEGAVTLKAVASQKVVVDKNKKPLKVTYDQLEEME